MEVSLVIKHRLKELALEQRDLASAAEVTEAHARKEPCPNVTSAIPTLFDRHHEQSRIISKRSAAECCDNFQDLALQISRSEPSMLHDQPDQPRFPEFFVVRVCRLGDSVGEEYQAVAAREFNFALPVVPLRENTKKRPAVAQSLVGPVCVDEDRRVMTAVRIDQLLGRAVEPSVEERHKFLRACVGANDRVHPGAGCR